MARIRASIVLVICSIAATALTLATPLEEAYMRACGWSPGLGGPANDILAQHNLWHSQFPTSVAGIDFVEYHREFLAESDDYRLFDNFSPGTLDPACTPVVADRNELPRSLLTFPNQNFLSSTFERVAGHNIDQSPLPPQASLPHTQAPIDSPLPGTESDWRVRPSNLRMGNPTFCGYTANQFGLEIDDRFHGNGHQSVGLHDQKNGVGDMLSPTTAPEDGAFYQWHKNIDNIYSDWAVSQYQLCDKSGLPIYFSMSQTGVGLAGSALNRRRQSDVYQAVPPPTPPPATQYGAIPRIASDIYVGNNNSSNLQYATGVRKWSCPNNYDPNLAWDIDAFTVLNPVGSGWYFSVKMGATGLPGTAVNAQVNAKGGDVFSSPGNGTNAVFRTETNLGLVAAGATDELDALEVDTQRRIQGTNDNGSSTVYDRPKQWFSLRAGSTQGVKAQPGNVTVGPSDILQFDSTGRLTVAVAGTVLGLGPTDDLDALVIVDSGTTPNALDPSDKIYYSLTAASPSNVNPGGGDIYCHTVAGVACGANGPPAKLEATGAMLGLTPTDELDALDVIDTAPTTGACCHSNGTCNEVTAAACNNPGDSFSSLGTTCETAACGLGACCRSNGTCTDVSNTVCLRPTCVGGSNAGTQCPNGTECTGGGVCSRGQFTAVGVTCGSLPTACPVAPPNDECQNAYNIPYNIPTPYYPGAPGVPYSDNTYASYSYYDPPYSCRDPYVFFPAYGSGSIWYSYDLPANPQHGLYLTTEETPTYSGYAPGINPAGDTRIAIYYAPNGNCNTLEEKACNDNYGSYSYYGTNKYARVQYCPTQPGRYYVQVSTVGDVYRGGIRLKATEANGTTAVPMLSTWGLVVLTLLLGAGAFLLRRSIVR